MTCAAEFQEHVQAEATAGQLVGRGRYVQHVADDLRQDDGAGSQAQEAHEH